MLKDLVKKNKGKKGLGLVPDIIVSNCPSDKKLIENINTVHGSNLRLLLMVFKDLAKNILLPFTSTSVQFL